jgi:hypothetical protein
MFSLTYISIRTTELDDKVLDQIIELANHMNEIHDITGQLLSCEYFIVQTIEGERSKVEQLFDNIKRDTRHIQVEAIDRREIDARTYITWMARKVIGVTEFASKMRELNFEKYTSKS